MPLLDSNDLKNMEAWRGKCHKCGSDITKNYCRQCDEFFHEHTARPLDQKPCDEDKHGHEGHRTY